MGGKLWGLKTGAKLERNKGGTKAAAGPGQDCAEDQLTDRPEAHTSDRDLI